MKIQPTSVVCILTFSLLLISCKGADGPVGASGPKLKGDITGLVLLLNEDGSQPSNKSGVSITIEGTSYTATTDASGSYTIAGVETGIYSITYSKTGYGLTKNLKYQFSGGGQAFVGTTTLCQPATFSVSNLSNPSGSTIAITLSPAVTAIKSVILFIGNNNSVSSNPQNYLTAIVFVSSTFTNGVLSTSLSQSTYRSAGLVSGNTAYIIAYGINDGSRFSGYTDFSTGRFVYTSVGATPSNVLSITVP